MSRQSASFNPRIDSWYSVEQWEVDLCSKWGGTYEAQSEATSSTGISLSQTTLSLQGRKQDYNIKGVNESLYTLSWYLEPLAEMSYTIELTDDDEIKTYRIDSGQASFAKPAGGYKSEYYSEDYTYLKMTYGTNWLRVPLVQ